MRKPPYIIGHDPETGLIILHVRRSLILAGAIWLIIGGIAMIAVGLSGGL
jgi:hypothetical protein